MLRKRKGQQQDTCPNADKETERQEENCHGSPPSLYLVDFLEAYD